MKTRTKLCINNFLYIIFDMGARHPIHALVDGYADSGHVYIHKRCLYAYNIPLYRLYSIINSSYVYNMYILLSCIYILVMNVMINSNNLFVETDNQVSPI